MRTVTTPVILHELFAVSGVKEQHYTPAIGPFRVNQGFPAEQQRYLITFNAPDVNWL